MWGDPFKSLIVEENEAAKVIFAWIHVAPVRAGMVNVRRIGYFTDGAGIGFRIFVNQVFASVWIITC